MKYLVLALVLLFSSCKMATAGMNLPEPSGYVVDQVGVLYPGTIQKLTDICTAFDNKAQIAVVVVNSTQPYSIEEYSIKLAEKWRVGYKGKDNGIIILLAKSDRKVRIEVGRGLESIITDARAGQIVQDIIIPFFKRADWNGGLVAGVNAITKELK